LKAQNNEKRIAIFIVYDEDGELDSYRKTIIEELLSVSEKLIIIINGNMNDTDLAYLYSITDMVYMRENNGYEMKAYQELFLDFVPCVFWNNYDEIIMCNDSFYGPFIPLKEIFSTMEDSTTDYWGINKVCNGYVEYISSYFVVYRRNIIKSNAIIDYFENCKKYKIDEFMQVVQIFEVGLFYYLKSRNYKSATYMKGIANNITKYPDYYLINRNAPCMKRKSFCDGYNAADATERALNYLKEFYDISSILCNAHRKYGYEIKECTNQNGEDEENEIILGDGINNKENLIIEFCKRNKSVYIYGAGLCAKKVWAAYRHYINNFKGFIVSDNQKITSRVVWGEPVFYYKELKEPIAIIVAIKDQKDIFIKEKDTFI